MKYWGFIHIPISIIWKAIFNWQILPALYVELQLDVNAAQTLVFMVQNVDLSSVLESLAKLHAHMFSRSGCKTGWWGLLWELLNMEIDSWVNCYARPLLSDGIGITVVTAFTSNTLQTSTGHIVHLSELKICTHIPWWAKLVQLWKKILGVKGLGTEASFTYP